MELATADAVQPRDGEAAFILQLRPPATAHAEALAAELERFTSLYLERAATDHVRFTPLGALTWALCAPSASVEDVDAACDALAQTLFGDPASKAVHLARQPDHPRDEDYHISNQSLSDEEGEAVMDDLAEHEWDFGTGQNDEETECAGSNSAPSALSASLDEDADSIDLDDFVPSPEAQDDWELERPLEADTLALDEDELEAALSDADDAASDDESQDLSAPDTTETSLDVDEGGEFDSMDMAEHAADPMTETAPTIDEPAFESGPAPASDDEPDLSFDLEQDAQAQDSLDIEDELEEFVLEGEESRPPHPGIWDEDVDTVDIDDIAASALHETRLGSNLDVAAELNAFREEMRAIARSIPAGGLDDTLSDFRASLESLSGELGQRVDGAAQRIEAAVGQLDVDRYDAASQRVESAASLMETSIHEALEALKRAGAAMSAPTASDMLDAQDRDSV
ncbi:MAG: hypothetical protein CMH91_02300 [Oceanicaulis sp.]|uniref:hypothetical protein n=1 Tax=unclassified Oceanicaulis TaxID=2632123 RepID=UPI000C51DFE0|nr:MULTISPECIES: hypothetical protein [unclassified Oceanicaulis]MAB70263.1 hypothetical protein [Oceanicaulis sp.]MBC37877.1 hypothetical protein [Oceanicaulis sp.]MBG34634.1 hypothetical protein [Oceanicaulis sp.]HBU61261.1 hypothetical protein [Oceanicaulis sp.]HCR94637.1 hypothetical protein [Oceanicaulis sp.]|tara:strand:+ start:474 stop:1841 length:1368 start_codon:yes stop_codon:yes gene_type:complete